MGLNRLEQDYRLGVAFGISLLIVSVFIAIMLMPTRDSGTDSGPASVDAGTDSGSAMSDAGWDSGPSLDSGVTGGALVITIAGSTAWCPSGGTPDIRVFDHNGTPFSSHRTLTFADPGAVYVTGDVINVTVYCTFSSMDLQWDGYVSPVLTGSTIGSEAESIGAHVRFEGEERPAFLCWDTHVHANPEFHRIQFHNSVAQPADCVPGTR
jgi:hypothetical protein